MKELEEKLLELANSGIDFAQQQIPEVAQEYLLFKTVQHGLLLFLSAITGIVAYKLISYTKNNWDQIYRKDVEIFYVLSSAFSCIIFMPMFFINLSKFIMVLVAPRVYIIETLMN